MEAAPGKLIWHASCSMLPHSSENIRKMIEQPPCGNKRKSQVPPPREEHHSFRLQRSLKENNK
jgi:hypothetical protein